MDDNQEKMTKKGEFIDIKVSIPRKYRDFILRLIIFIIATLLFLGGRQSYLNKKTVAMVNEKRIFYDEFYERLKRIYGDRILERMIEEVLVKEEEEKYNIKVNKGEIEDKIKELIEQLVLNEVIRTERDFPAYLKKNSMTKQDLEEQIRLGMVLNKLVERKIKEKDLKEYYRQHREEFVRPEIVRLRRILIATENETKRVMRALKRGADFIKLAQEKSKDLNSKGSGGDLGYLSVEQLPEDIETAIKDKGVGDVVLVKTNEGFNILKIEDRLPADLEDFKRVKGKIKERLIAKGLEKYIKELKKKAKIKKFLTGKEKVKIKKEENNG